MQFESALPEMLGVDAAALELEQEAKARPEQIVQVVHGQGGERVRVKRRGRAAAQPRHELLLEEPLTGLVEDAHLAGRAAEIGELVEQTGADAVEGPDPGSIQSLRTEIRAACGQLVGDPQAQLFGGPVAEGNGEDLIGSYPLLDQPAEPLCRGECLSGAWAGRDEERADWPGVSGGSLLSAQHPPADARRAHSGGAPPYGDTAPRRQEPNRLTQVPGSSRGAGSKCPALMRSIAVATTVRLRCRSSSVSGFSDRKSTRLNSSHLVISYAVFCLK